MSSEKEADLRRRGFRPFQNVSGGNTQAHALVEPITGLQQRPCNMCRSWEKNDARIRELVKSRKFLTVDPDGTLRHKIDRDVPGRNTQTVNLNDFGYCRFHGQLAQQLHSCEAWTPTVSLSDFARKFPQKK